MTTTNDYHNDDHGNHLRMITIKMITTKMITTMTTTNSYEHKKSARKNYGEVYDLIMDKKVKFSETDFCLTHQKHCRRLASTAGKDVLTIEVAGSPCPDWSNFGKHGKDAGASAPLFVALTLDGNGFFVGNWKLEFEMDSCITNSNCVALSAFRIKAVKQSLPSIFIHENVPGFPKSTLAMMLGEVSVN